MYLTIFKTKKTISSFCKFFIIFFVFSFPVFAKEKSNNEEISLEQEQILENQWFIYKKNKLYRGPFQNKYQVLATWHKEKIPQGKKYYVYLNEMKISNVPEQDFDEYIEISESVELFGEEAYNDFLVEETVVNETFTFELEENIETKPTIDLQNQNTEAKIEEVSNKNLENLESKVIANDVVNEESKNEDSKVTENKLQKNFFDKQSSTQKTEIKRYKKEYLQDYIPVEKPTLVTDAIQEPTMVITNPDLADSDGKTLLMNAAKSGNDWEIKQLLDSNADVNKIDNEGWTALMYAVRFQDNVNIVNMLLKAGADVKIQNNFGNTALVIASCYNNNPQILNQLLKYYDSSSKEVLKSFILLITSNNTAEYTQLSKIKVFLNRSTPINSFYNGKTPLMYAAEFSNSTKLIKLLLDNDAIVTLRSTEGKNAYDYAVDNEALVHDEVFWSLNKN